MRIRPLRVSEARRNEEQGVGRDGVDSHELEPPSSPNTDAPAFVKAAARDVRAYLRGIGSTRLVSYAATDGDAAFRNSMAHYMTCGPEETTVDLYGTSPPTHLAARQWCGQRTHVSSVLTHRFEQLRVVRQPKPRLVQLARHYAGVCRYPSSHIHVRVWVRPRRIPRRLARRANQEDQMPRTSRATWKHADIISCITSPPRVWNEVDALYAAPVSDVFSGGVAFSYFPTNDGYGMVTFSGNNGST